MPQWPENLPLRPPDGAFAVQLIDPAIRNQPDLGPPLVRLRASVEWEIWQGTLTLTTDEKDQLLDFWRTDCARGTAEYQVLHWTSIGTEVTVRWGDIPGPIEHVAKDYWRVGIHWIKMP